MIRYSNGIIEDKMKCTCFWAGVFSTVYQNGTLFHSIVSILKDKNVTFIMPQSDGDIREKELEHIIETISTDSILLIGSVAQRFYEPKLHYLLLPQDDGIFEFGLRHYIWPEFLPKWENRIPKVFWRGSGSRRSGFLRRDVVLKLSENQHADVKFIPNWIYKEDDIPVNCIDNQVNYLEFAKYKMVLIIDGNGISSAHSWCFGIGCVPFMITNNDFWFKHLLIPFGNYIPIKYDLSDLEEKIEWVLEHDVEAREIAERSTTFAYHIFTPEFQKNYLETCILDII